MRKALFSFGFLFASVHFACAQSVAVRFIMGEVNTVYKHPTISNYCMGIGVDRTFNDRLTIGLDIGYDLFGVIVADFGNEVFSYDGGISTYYRVQPHLLTLNYHTEFALSDNDGTHFYVGTFVGLRHISQKWTGDGYLNNYGNPVVPKESKWLVPLGLRVGVRGTTDGGFVDFYNALGYQVGGNTKLAKPPGTSSKTKYTETSPLAFTIGLAYGFGW